MLNIIIKSFNQLSVDELYAILHLRSEVFVVEQNCVYQDIDYQDQAALHIMGFKNEQLVAYTRVFRPDAFGYASIGRVLVKAEKRNFEYGYQIMQTSINIIAENYKETKIKISAQTYLKRFYNNLGFVEVGEGYLEDGIPHIKMVKH